MSTHRRRDERTRRVRGGAHKGPRITARERRRAERAVRAAELEKTLAWFAEVRALEDTPLEPSRGTGAAVTSPLTADQEQAQDALWDRWAAAQQDRAADWPEGPEPGRHRAGIETD